MGSEEASLAQDRYDTHDILIHSLLNSFCPIDNETL
jgi:hypothetical protein